MATKLYLGACWILVFALCGMVSAQPAPIVPPPADAPKPMAAGLVYTLDQFGKVDTAAAAQAAFEVASKQLIAAGGGVIVIPAHTVAGWTPKNTTQEEWRSPAPPAPSNKTWGVGPGVTVVDCRGGTINIITPQATGMKMTRLLDLLDGQSLPHWNYNPMLTMENTIAHGSTSYRDWLQEEVKAGKAQRFYVPTIRGVFPGMFVNAQDYSTVQRLYVQSLGYDAEKKMWFFIADTDADVAKGAMLHNKNHANVIRMDTYSHNENQTFDLMLWRHNYSQGDNYLFDARFKYMGDVHSTAGDENGVIYAGFIEPEYDSFTGKVATWNAATGELTYTGGDASANTLGSGRPIINNNPKKAITAGTVNIVRPGDWTLTANRPVVDPVYRGKTYPTTVGKDRLGNTVLQVGGLIEFSADAPITKDVIGKYFAVDVPDEVEPKSKRRRWYLIADVTVNGDGTKTIKIIRHWWGAKQASSPTLYNPENYSSDGHIKPLKYIIAPGVNAVDVSEGLPKLTNKNLIRLSPLPLAGTAFDFEVGDPIEQAIGPDPFHPIPFRSWTWDSVPGIFPAPVFDIRGYGVQRGSVLNVAGGSSSIEAQIKNAMTHGPQYNMLINFEATSNDAIVFDADVVNAALFFRQPNERAQPIRWAYEKGVKEAELTVSPKDGAMKIEATSVAIPSGVTKIGGISGGDTKANNLRGVNVAVKAGAKELAVKFAKPESDANYSVFVEPAWMTMHVVTERTPEGFTVKFSEAPGADAAVQWLLVR